MTTVLITSAVWIPLAVAACLAMHRARQARPTVVRATYPPPVPPATCRQCERVDYLADLPVPVDEWLTPELSDRLFDDLIAMEGLQ